MRVIFCYFVTIVGALYAHFKVEQAPSIYKYAVHVLQIEQTYTICEWIFIALLILMIFLNKKPNLKLPLKKQQKVEKEEEIEGLAT